MFGLIEWIFRRGELSGLRAENKSLRQAHETWLEDKDDYRTKIQELAREVRDANDSWRSRYETLKNLLAERESRLDKSQAESSSLHNTLAGMERQLSISRNASESTQEKIDAITEILYPRDECPCGDKRCDDH